MNRIISAWTLPLLFAAAASALTAQEPQDYRIQGSVLAGQTDNPLSGAQVMVQGTRFGTLSNQEGRYVLQATLPPGDYTLSFSFIGRRTETVPVTLGNESVLTLEPVLLDESAVELDEIVVTGTGAPTQKRAIGNTVATVAGSEINDAPGASAVDVALQGKVTGAVISENSGQPGGGVSIRLRGTSSILGGAEPLVVIDGVIVDNTSEAMISLGANAGRGGAALTNRLSDISPSDIERIEVIKGAAAAALYGSKANNGVIQIFTRRGQQGEPRIRVSTEVSAGRTPDQYDLMMHPEATIADVTYGLAAAVGDTVQRIDYQDEIFRTGWGTRTNVSVSGGTENTTYYLSGGYQDETGILRGSEYQKVDARASVGQLVTDWLNVTATGHLIQTDAQFVPEGEQTQGVLTSVIFTPTSWNPFFDEEAGRYPYNPVLGQNPFDVIENWDAQDDVTRFVGSLEATARPLDALTLSYLVGYDDYRQENRYFRPPLSQSATFTGEINNPVRFSRQMNHDVRAVHEADLGDTFQLTSTLGSRYTRDWSQVIASTARNLPPGQELVGGATLVTAQSQFEVRTLGTYLQERLSINDRLYLTAGANYEASSAFGADERWQLFPRASVSWVIHEEPFFIDTPVGGLLSTLRLRAAYGQTGGQPPGAYDRFANYFDVSFGGQPGLVASTLAPNPDLKPERQEEIEAGFEMGFWNDRALIDFTYYTQTTDDLVLSVPLPPSSAYQARRENIGELTNQGLELALETVNIARDGFNWRTRLQFATNENEVTRLVTGADTIVTGYLNAVIEGQPVGVFYGGVYARNPDGTLSIDEAGLPFRARDTINAALCNTETTAGCPFASRVIGDPNPDWTASLSNQLNVGDNMTFSVLFDGRFGNDVANFTRRISEFFGADAVIARERTGEVPEGYYAFNPNGRIQVYEEYIEDGSFVKLRELALNYRFDQPWVQSFGAESMTLRLAGRDLWTWTNYSGLDPEVNLFSANTVARGVDFATTPIPQKLIVGLDFTF